MITKIIGSLTIVGILFSAWFFMDNRFATAGKVVEVKKEMEEKVENVKDSLEAVTKSVNKLNKKIDYENYRSQREYRQRRQWNLEDKYGHNVNAAPIEVKEEYRNNKIEIQRIEENIKKMEKK